MDVDSSSKFIASLTKFLQSLCNGYVDFENGVELVGHIYLSVDTGKKIDYILHEKVCKNDENSVTFISNSFHAQPFDKARSQTKQQTDTSKGKPRSEKIRDADKEDTAVRKDDDDDVVIVNAPKVGAENSDSSSMGIRGRKRPASPNSEQQQFQRPLRRSAEASLPSSSSPSSTQQSGQGSSVGLLQSSNGLRRKTAPSATVTSQEDHPDNFNSSDLKLEHMTTDELLSLASQVSDSSCSTNIIPPSSGSGSRSGGGDPSCQQVWVKQEVLDDDDSCLASGSGDSAHGQNWPVGRDPQSDANSGSSGLYPVMLHQNTAFPGPGGPFPPGFHGSPSSSQHPAFAQQSSSQGSANLFANPVPGTSQGGAVDPAASTRRRDEERKKSIHTGSSADFAEKLWTLLEEIKDTQVEHAKQISCLATRIESALDPKSRFDWLLPEDISLPLNTPEQLQDLEEKLQDSNNRSNMVRYLASIGGETPKEAMRRIMRRIMSSPLALQYNLSGVKGKKGFRDLAVKHVVFTAVRQLHPNTTEAELESVMAMWLTTARDRDGGRQRRSLQSMATALAQVTGI